MQMQEFMLALTSNIAHVAFWLAIVSTVITALGVIGIVMGDQEWEHIESLSLAKTFALFALIFWGLSALPGIQDVKSVQDEFKAKPSVVKHVKKVKETKEVKDEKD